MRTFITSLIGFIIGIVLTNSIIQTIEVHKFKDRVKELQLSKVDKWGNDEEYINEN